MPLNFTGELDVAHFAPGGELGHIFIAARNAAEERLNAVVEMGGSLITEDIADAPGATGTLIKLLHTPKLKAGDELGVLRMGDLSASVDIGSASFAGFFITGDSYNSPLLEYGTLPYTPLTWGYAADKTLIPVPTYIAGGELVTSENRDFYFYGIGQMRYTIAVPSHEVTRTYLTDPAQWSFPSTGGTGLLYQQAGASFTAVANLLWGSPPLAAHMESLMDFDSDSTNPLSPFTSVVNNTSISLNTFQHFTGQHYAYILKSSTTDKIRYVEGATFINHEGTSTTGGVKSVAQLRTKALSGGSGPITEQAAVVVAPTTVNDILKLWDTAPLPSDFSLNSVLRAEDTQASFLAADYSACFDSNSSIL